MAKKFFPKALSVGLSLALCATMVAPAFAATFKDVNHAINSEEASGTQNGVSWSTSENQRNITLNESVTYDGKEDDKSIVIDNKDVTVNLNGNTIDGGNHAEKTDEEGNVTQKATKGSSQSVITVKNGASLTVNGADESGKKGTITGGSAYTGGGINSTDSNLTLNDVSFTDNKANSGGSAVWAGTHKPENGKVQVNMDKVEFKGNEVTGATGGAVNLKGANAELKNIVIDNNTNGGAAGGISFQNCGKVEVTDAEITNNKCTGEVNYSNPLGGGVYADGTESITMDHVTISGNEVNKSSTPMLQGSSGHGGGMYALNCGEITLNNSEISGNTAAGFGGGLTAFSTNGGTTVIKTDNTVIVGNKGLDVGDDCANDVFVSGSVSINAGSATYGGKNFDGWTNSLNTEEKVESTKSEDGVFGNVYDGSTVGLLTSDWATPEEPDPGIEIPDPDVPLGPDPSDTEIEDPVVPLAGLFTRGDAIGYLWEQSGSSEAELSTFEDVPEDHQWAVAIGWAQDMGIARADEEGNFRPDDLVLRGVEDLEIDPEGELQEFLNWYAQYAGVELDEDELFIELEGALDDVIMGEEAQVIFDDFFAKLEAALAAMAA